MKKNFKNVGLILGMVAMTAFTMTSCAEAEAAAEEVKTEAEATTETVTETVTEEVETVVEEAKCGEGAAEMVETAVEGAV